MYNPKTRRNYCGDNIRQAIAQEIVTKTNKTYAEIADEFCISEETVRRIARQYGVGRNSQKY